MRIYIFLFILIICSSTAIGQKKYPNDSIRNTYRKEFLVNPIPFFIGGFELGYGKIDAKRRNLRMFAGYYFAEKPYFYNTADSTVSTKVSHKNLQGFKLEGQYLFMKPIKNNLCFYGGFFATLKTISMDITRTFNGSSVTASSNYKAWATSGSFGVMGGARQYITDNFFADVYFGGGITAPFAGSSIDDVHLDIVSPFKRSINPKFGLTFGLSF